MFKMIKKIARTFVGFCRGVKCDKCKSYNVKLERFSVVDPEFVKDAYWIAAGYSMAAKLGWKSAKGNYKKIGDRGTIYQTRAETYCCQDCGNKFAIHRERVVASHP